MSKTPLLVIAGETASGKTAVAIELARTIGGELIGADSVQVYRGFDIGSAKPTPDELGDVAHHLIDVRDADSPLDAMQYAALADTAIDDVVARGRVPIVVGGTGLWLRALLRGLVALPPVDPAIRGALEEEADRVGAPALHARLGAIDARAAAAIHPNDRLRIVRALEVHAQTGVALGELRAQHALGERRPSLFLVLTPERSELERRIETRARAMWERGLETEARALLERFGPGVRPLGAVGYRQVVAHILADPPPAAEDTLDAIVRATRLYARRQRTWFASDPGVDRRIAPDEATRAETVSWITTELERRRV